MKIQRIMEILEAEILCCGDRLGSEVLTACGSDMMSDVLAFVKDQSVMLSGLVNPQVIRTAEMMDMLCVVFVRGKKPTGDILKLAEESGICVLSTRHTMFTACGMLYEAGLRGGPNKK